MVSQSSSSLGFCYTIVVSLLPRRKLNRFWNAMKINFRNVGNIKNLDFELSQGLMLFCGPNSTGKTYAAYVIYSILDRLDDISAKWLNRKSIDALISDGTLSIDLSEVSESDEFLKDLSRKVAQGLADDFDAPNNFFARDCVRILEMSPKNNKKQRVRGQTEMRFGNTQLSLSFRGNKLTVSMAQSSSSDDIALIAPDFLLNILNQNITNIFFRHNFGTAHVLTAERAAINLFSRELSSSRNNLVDQLLKLESSNSRSDKIGIDHILGRKTTRYSLPIRKGLEIAEDLKNISNSEGDYKSFADQLEQEVLDGRIRVGEYGELLYSKGENPALRINLTASMIKSLASLVVYLRHQARKGDLLIIDEPELNLHPSSQCKLARFLCELSNEGLNIIISTHSDYIIREINNLILLKNPAMSLVKDRYHYKDAQLLAHENVSVVQFNAEGLPEQLVVGKSGFSITSIDEQINVQNQIAEDIEAEWSE